MFRKKKKKPFGKLVLGLDVKRCAECHGPERLCLADGKPATFHRWVEDNHSLLQLDSATIETRGATFALVEYPDGSVGKVKPELIQFMDREG